MGVGVVGCEDTLDYLVLVIFLLGDFSLEGFRTSEILQKEGDLEPLAGHSPVEFLQDFDEVAYVLEIGFFVVKAVEDDLACQVNIGVG